MTFLYLLSWVHNAIIWPAASAVGCIYLLCIFIRRLAQDVLGLEYFPV